MEKVFLQPVFIGGCERSGTTLLGAMLGANKEVITTPEGQFIIEAYVNIEDKGVTQDILKRIGSSWRFKLWGMNLNYVYEQLYDQEVNYADLILQIVHSYSLHLGKKDQRFWIDHTPWNMRYASFLNKLFPEAKFIHIVRDGRAVAASLRNVDWGIPHIEKAARFWAEKLAYGLAAEQFLGDQKVLRVYYEELVEQTDTTIQRICQFLDLPFSHEMISSTGFKVPIYTASQHELIGKKPDKNRIFSWKNELSLRQVEIFESIVGDLLTFMGYQPVFRLGAKGPTKLEKISMDLDYLVQHHFLNRWRFIRRKSKSLFAYSKITNG